MRKTNCYPFMLLILITGVLFITLFSCQEIYAISDIILVGFPVNTPPFQFLDDQDNPIGMHIDIMKSIAEERDLVFEFIPFDNSIAAKKAFMDGELDLLLGIEKPLVSNYNPQMLINLSSVNLSLFAPKDVESKLTDSNDYRSYKVVFENDTVAVQILSSIPVKYFIVTANQVDLINHQLKGKSDLIVGVKESILFQLNQMGLEREYVIMNKHLGYLSYVMQISNKEKELFHILEHEMARLQATRGYERIYNKWIIEEENKVIKRIVKNVAYIAGVLTLLALIFIFVNIRIRRLLKKRIEKQTHEIRNANLELEYRIQQIQDANELRNRIIKNSPISMILFGRDYNITLINKSACDLAGIDNIVDSTYVMDLPIFGYILKDIKNVIFEDDYISSNSTIVIEEDSGINKNYRYGIQQIRESNQVNGALITLEDITKEENEKKALFEKEKSQMLNKVVAGIAHEIRNPLTSIRTFVTLAKSDISDIRLKKFFDKYIPDEVNRINRLVESLINYAKPSSNKKDIINVSVFISECVFFIKNIIRHKGIIIKKNIPDNLKIYADKDQIKQVLINILINSIESIEEKLKNHYGVERELYLEVSIQNYNNNVIICVQDEGLGMKDEILKYCMDPFFTTKKSGTGIGLALSKQYIEENNGKILIESQAGKYTKIQIVFRRYQDET